MIFHSQVAIKLLVVNMTFSKHSMWKLHIGDKDLTEATFLFLTYHHMKSQELKNDNWFNNPW